MGRRRGWGKEVCSKVTAVKWATLARTQKERTCRTIFKRQYERTFTVALEVIIFPPHKRVHGTNFSLKVLPGEWGHVPFPITCHWFLYFKQSSFIPLCFWWPIIHPKRFCQSPVEFLSQSKWMLHTNFEGLRERSERLQPCYASACMKGCNKQLQSSLITHGRKLNVVWVSCK